MKKKENVEDYKGISTPGNPIKMRREFSGLFFPEESDQTALLWEPNLWLLDLDSEQAIRTFCENLDWFSQKNPVRHDFTWWASKSATRKKPRAHVVLTDASFASSKSLELEYKLKEALLLGTDIRRQIHGLNMLKAQVPEAKCWKLYKPNKSKVSIYDGFTFTEVFEMYNLMISSMPVRSSNER